MAVYELYDGPVDSIVTGDWVEVSPSALYVVAQSGFNPSAIAVQFSLDGVSPLEPSTSIPAAPFRLATSGSEASAWQLTNFPVLYARYKNPYASAGQVAKSVLLAL